jgi:hypothetical protein
MIVSIGKQLITIVNYYAKMLIIKNGIFFDLLKSCSKVIKVRKSNKNLFFVLTVLTA